MAGAITMTVEARRAKYEATVESRLTPHQVAVLTPAWSHPIAVAPPRKHHTRYHFTHVGVGTICVATLIGVSFPIALLLI